MPGSLHLRGAIFTLLVPGVVGGWMPVLLADGPPAGGAWHAGWFIVAIGALGYLMCLLRFLGAGGTPMIYFARPLRFVVGEEPRALVTRGLYQRTRNPMYLSVLAVIAGQAIAFASIRIGLYAVLMAAVFDVVVRRVEEPHLRAARGAGYDDYCRRVPRWL